RLVHPRRRAHRHDRGRGGAVLAPGARGVAGVAPSEHRRRGPEHHPGSGAACPPDAPRPDRRRRVPRGRDPGHAAGDEHTPRRLAHDGARQQPAGRAEPGRDADDDGGAGAPIAGDPGPDRLRCRHRDPAVAPAGRHSPHHAPHRGDRAGGRDVHPRRCLRLPPDRRGAGRQGLRAVRADRIRPRVRRDAGPPRYQGAAGDLPAPERVTMFYVSLLFIAISIGLLAFTAGHAVRRWWLARTERYASWMAVELGAMFQEMTVARAQRIITATVLGGLTFGFLLGDGPLGRTVAGVVLGLGGYFGPWAVVKYLRKRRLDQIDDQLVDALRMMANALKAGLSLQQALELVRREMKAPISDEFGTVVKEIHLGQLTDHALRRMAERVPL